MSLTSQLKWGVALVASCVAGCGGGGGGAPPPATHSVSGYASGLTGSGLTLSYNGGAPIAISRNGVFTAATGVATGTAYSVAIVDQPSNPAQACTVSNSNGTVGATNVASVAVFCPQAVGTRAYVVGAGVPGLPQFQIPGSISIYAIDTSSGALTLVTGSVVSTGPGVASFQLIPHSNFAWALNVAEPGYDEPGSIYDYTVDPTTGLLTAVAGSPFQTLNDVPTAGRGCSDLPAPGIGSAFAVTFLATGGSGYASDASGGPAIENDAVLQFTVDPTTGAPSVVPGGFVTTACPWPGPVTIDPSGQFAYVTAATNSGEGIYAYRIDATTGALTPVPGSPFSPPGKPGNSANGPLLTIDPTGRFIYLPSSSEYSVPEIFAFNIDPTTGALTPIAGSPFATASAPFALSIAPGGQFAYVTQGTTLAYTINIYAINAATGALTATGASTVPTVFSPAQIDPSGQFAYILGPVGPTGQASTQTGVYAYAINADTGALTQVPGSPYAASAGPGSPTVVTVVN